MHIVQSIARSAFVVAWLYQGLVDPITELEITAGHQTFSDQVVEMTDQIPHATP